VVAAWSPAALCIAVALCAGAAGAGWWAFEQSRGSDDHEGVARPGARARMEPWVPVAAALAVALIVIAPRLIGVAFLALPFVLTRRRRSAPPGRPHPPDEDPEG
jgi:hypothetical protein